MRKKNSRGLSLLEVVFAFAILELGLLAIIGSFPTITEMNKNAWKISIATQLAQEKMEEILQGQYDLERSLSTSKTSSFSDKPSTFENSVRLWWFEPDPLDLDSAIVNNDVWVVKVRVEWLEGSMKRNVTLSGLLYLYNEKAGKGYGVSPYPSATIVPEISGTPEHRNDSNNSD